MIPGTSRSRKRQERSACSSPLRWRGAGILPRMPAQRNDRAAIDKGREGTNMDLSGVTTLADVSRVQARLRGNAPAQIDAGGGTTFGELDAMASRIANRLIAEGIRPQERIAYLVEEQPIFPSVPARRLQGARDAGADQFPPCRLRDRLHPRRQRREAPVRRSGFRRDRAEGGRDARSEASTHRARFRARWVRKCESVDRERRGARSRARGRSRRRRDPALHLRNDGPAQGRATDEPATT